MDRIAAARDFLAQYGRDVDRARFAHHIDGAPVAGLLEALERYQNPDGGFGHGLEPDIEAPGSNPFATELALFACLQARVPADHPLLGRTVEYLERTQIDDGDWQFTPDIHQHPLAPWFAGWTWPSLNPGCTIDALLRQLGLGSESLHARVAALFDRMARPEDLARDDYYAARPYAYLALADWRHPQRDLYRGGVVWWLIRQHANGTIPDAGHFFDYVRDPGTPVAAMLPSHIVGAELDRLASEQAEDGGWPSPYAAHWRGPITAQNMIVLRLFDRV